MEDSKIECVDLCLLPSKEINIVAVDSGVGSPSKLDMGIPSSTSSDPAVRSRRRSKLDHLTNEEKAEHKKMIKRMCNKRGRDKQKALINKQESTIKSLIHTVASTENKNVVLTSINGHLHADNIALKEENHRLSSLVAKLELALNAANHNLNVVKSQTNTTNNIVITDSVFYFARLN